MGEVRNLKLKGHSSESQNCEGDSASHFKCCINHGEEGESARPPNKKNTLHKSFSIKEKDLSASFCNIPDFPVAKERKQSKVKMVVSSGNNCKSIFKPVSGFAPLNIYNEKNKLPLRDFKPLRLISSFGEVVPLKPAEGFVFIDQKEKRTNPHFYTEHAAVLSSLERDKISPHFALPSLKIFDEDNTLILKSTYLSPPNCSFNKKLNSQSIECKQNLQSDRKSLDCSSKKFLVKENSDLKILKKKKLFQDDKRSNDSWTLAAPKPRSPGSLFVKPIRQHCSTGSGELYVAPVDTSIINEHKCYVGLPAKGISRLSNRSEKALIPFQQLPSMKKEVNISTHKNVISTHALQTGQCSTTPFPSSIVCGLQKGPESFKTKDAKYSQLSPLLQIKKSQSDKSVLKGMQYDSKDANLNSFYDILVKNKDKNFKRKSSLQNQMHQNSFNDEFNGHYSENMLASFSKNRPSCDIFCTQNFSDDTTTHKPAARAFLTEVLATKMASVPNNKTYSFPLNKSHTTSISEEITPTNFVNEPPDKNSVRNLSWHFKEKRTERQDQKLNLLPEVKIRTKSLLNTNHIKKNLESKSSKGTNG